MRKFHYAIVALGLALIFGRAASAQETFTSGSYDPSPCNDASRIADREQRENARAFYESPQPNGSSPLLRAIGEMVSEPGGSYGTGACADAPGIIYFIPKDRVGEVERLIGQIEAGGGPSDDRYSGRDQPDTSDDGGPSGRGRIGRPEPGGWTPQPVPGGINDPCHPYYDMSTAAGQAAMQRNHDADMQRCNAQRCRDNPQLLSCPDKVYVPARTQRIRKPPNPKAPKVQMGGAMTPQMDNTPTIDNPEPLHGNADQATVQTGADVDPHKLAFEGHVMIKALGPTKPGERLDISVGKGWWENKLIDGRPTLPPNAARGATNPFTRVIGHLHEDSEGRVTFSIERLWRYGKIVPPSNYPYTIQLSPK